MSRLEGIVVPAASVWRRHFIRQAWVGLPHRRHRIITEELQVGDSDANFPTPAWEVGDIHILPLLRESLECISVREAGLILCRLPFLIMPRIISVLEVGAVDAIILCHLILSLVLRFRDRQNVVRLDLDTGENKSRQRQEQLFLRPLLHRGHMVVSRI
jgi:hypothetical protein